MRKKWIAMGTALGMALTLLTAPLPGAAAELPQAFWSLNDAYAAAKDAGDDQGIIATGEEVIALLTAQEETQQIKEILASRYYDVADAYDRQGNFAKAAAYYQTYLPYGDMMGWEDGVRIARAKIRQYTPTVALYTQAAQSQKTYGAKNEPNGVLYGQVADHTRGEESMVLLYVDFGKELGGWEQRILREAQERGAAVEIAWNLQGESGALAGVSQQGEYISRFLDSLNQYDIPIYLRFGAEMNSWQPVPDPEAYRSAFRFVADMVHRQSPRAATVWSVTHASDWNTDMADFYPGDEYVDWVGVSAYLVRHFLGQASLQGDRLQEVLYGAGDAADPVMVVEEVVEKFGDRKPIMLAECGAAHTTVSLGTDNTDWAAANLRRMYWFVPMVYPQVKLIAYFNNYVAPEHSDFSLTDCPALEQAYNEVTQAGHFIQGSAANRGTVFYAPLNSLTLPGAGTLPLYAYPHVYGDAEPTVRYSVDGQVVGERSRIPYALELNTAAYGLGVHTLTAEVVSGGVSVASAAYQFGGTGAAQPGGITVLVNGAPLASDVAPVMERDRVLVPMRAIFEALGAQVGWEDSTQTAKADRNGVHIEITIDQQTLWKNGTEEHLDVPARLIEGRTMVPLRAVSQALGAQVRWEDETQTAVIEQ